MSMTDLKAFVDSWLMGARKLPAAPALEHLGQFEAIDDIPGYLEQLAWPPQQTAVL
jgi:hypothetical protein